MQYFEHVRAALQTKLGDEAFTFHDVPTLPTAGLERRATRLAEVVLQHAEPGDDLHFVGHSTGGLDARLATSTAWTVPLAGWDAMVGQTRSVVSIASPHAGAPIATFFSTVQGEHWLRLISLLTLRVVRLGSVGTASLGGLMKAAVNLNALAGMDTGLLDSVWNDVLQDFDESRREELRDFFKEVWADRSLLAQLSPEGIREIAPHIEERPSVRYASVVMQGARPSSVPRLSDLRPSRLIYMLLHRRAGADETLVRELSGHVDPVGRRALSDALEARVGEQDNDAMVPTLSQAHGELLHAGVGDHLDVIGYFDGGASNPEHVDWLRSQSGFDRAAFDRIWSKVAGWIDAASAAH